MVMKAEFWQLNIHVAIVRYGFSPGPSKCGMRGFAFHSLHASLHPFILNIAPRTGRRKGHCHQNRCPHRDDNLVRKMV